MTRRTLRRLAGAVVALYALAIAGGIYLRYSDRTPDNRGYETFKDLISLVVAIPAAALALAFQRRTSYMQSLRSLWGTLLGAVHSARAYTQIDVPSRELHSSVLLRLSIAIDEVRGVFQNLPAKGKPRGWYPFEPLKQIHNLVAELGYGTAATVERRAAARRHIDEMWTLVRDQMLLEFDRDVPTFHHAGYAARFELPTVAAENAEAGGRST